MMKIFFQQKVVPVFFSFFNNLSLLREKKNFTNILLQKLFNTGFSFPQMGLASKSISMLDKKHLMALYNPENNQKTFFFKSIW